jgi:hypothetical protein
LGKHGIFRVSQAQSKHNQEAQMGAVLYGFSIGDQGHEPVWFYHQRSAENYLRVHKLDWLIDTASENDVDPDSILDTEDTVWISET